VRKYAAYALGQLNDQRAIDPLTRASKDADVDVRDSVAHALWRLQREKSSE
jgi:HEAT repeat protein